MVDDSKDSVTQARPSRVENPFPGILMRDSCVQRHIGTHTYRLEFERVYTTCGHLFHSQEKHDSAES